MNFFKSASLFCGIFALTCTSIHAKPSASLIVKAGGSDTKLLPFALPRAFTMESPYATESKFELLRSSTGSNPTDTFVLRNRLTKKVVLTAQTPDYWFDTYQMSTDEQYLFLAAIKVDKSLWVYPDGHVSRKKTVSPTTTAEYDPTKEPQNANWTEIHVIDIKKAMLLRTFNCLGDTTGMVSSQDLLSANVDAKIYMWNFKTGKRIWKKGVVRYSDYPIAFSPNSKFLMCSGPSTISQIVMRDSRTGETISTLINEDAVTSPFAFTPDNKFVATSAQPDNCKNAYTMTNPETGEEHTDCDNGGDNYHVLIWEIKSGKAIKTLSRKSPPQLNSFKYEPVKFIANGEQLVVYSYEHSGMDVWKWKSGKIISLAGKQKSKK